VDAIEAIDQYRPEVMLIDNFVPWMKGRQAGPWAVRTVREITRLHGCNRPLRILWTTRPFVHQGIGDLTPAERYQLGFEIPHSNPPPLAATSPTPAEETIKQPCYPPHSILRLVSTIGEIGFQGMGINVGSRWKGATVRVIEIGELIHIYHGDGLIPAA